MISAIAAREDYNNVLDVFQRAFPDMDVANAFQFTQTTLRLEQPLVANQNQYRFPVIVNEVSANGLIFNTEIRLNMQDTFVPTSVGLYLATPGSNTATNFRLFSNPNQQQFGVNAVAYRSLYNGVMNISINNYRFVQNWSLHKFNQYPQTQQTAAFGAGSPEDQLDISACQWPVQPFVLFGGAQKIDISFNLAAGAATATATDRYVLIFEGMLGQNSTPVS